jgi:hypothetical protein
MDIINIDDYGVPVQRLWLFKLPWKMQTVINQGLRAPDTHFCRNVKLLCRWMRGIVLNNADQNHTFMCRKEGLPTRDDLQNELNYCTVHFVTHFLYSLEIIAYKHPDKETQNIAWNYYNGLVSEMMHFKPESEKELDLRLADLEEVKPLKSLIKSSNNIEKPPKLCPAYDPYVVSN